MYMNNEQKNNSDVRSLVENLIKTKDMRLGSDLGYGSPKPVLVRAEEKIFQEVVSLLMEINDVKEKIANEK